MAGSRNAPLRTVKTLQRNQSDFANAVDTGLPAMTLHDATTVFREGGIGTFDLVTDSWRNDTTGGSGSDLKLPGLILDIKNSCV
jgi:3-isopropylmalate/(R)-2-methylmalate dehydratase small subunit